MNNDKVIAVWKNKGMTSLDALRLVKRKLNVDKIGHCGTLDPFAEGILILCTGSKTKEIDSFMNYEKEYIATIFLGEETDTLDLTGKSVFKSKKNHQFNKEVIKEALNKYIGDIKQIPPYYSALKFHGIRLYDYARKGIYIRKKPRTVKVREISLLEIDEGNKVTIYVKCEKGTYIRSLARDLAHKLGTYGFATDIVRNKNSFFLSDNAIFINKILNTKKDNLIKLVLPVDYALKNYTQINVEKKYSKMIKDGRIINVENLKKVNNTNSLILIKCENRLVSIANLEKGYIIPRRNFNN